MTASHPKMAHADGGSPVVDTLRLSDSDVEEILAYLDHKQAGASAANGRTHRRYPYRRAPGLILNVSSPNGKHLRYKVVPRDISCSGLGLLIGTFLYPGTPATVHVLTVSSGVRALKGRITRCEHIRGRLHQVGMAFDADIDLTELIGGRLGGEEEASRPATTQLSGSVLYVDDCIDDRELMRFYTSQIGVRLTVTNNLAEAIDLIQSLSFDGVIASLELPGTRRDRICAAIRKAGYQKYVLGVTVAESDGAVEEALMNGCDHVLVKPYTVEQLLGVLGGFLPKAGAARSGEQTEPIRSSFWANTAMRPIIVSYLSRLDVKRRRLEEMVGAGALDEQAVGVIREIKGSAAGYGFAVLSESAQRVLDQVGVGPLPESARPAVEALCDQCRRACLAHAGGG